MIKKMVCIHSLLTLTLLSLSLPRGSLVPLSILWEAPPGGDEVASFLSSLLSVPETLLPGGEILCGGRNITIPSSPGLFIDVRYSTLESGIVAYSAPCVVDQSGRPIVGYMVLNNLEYLTFHALLHEVTHILGFSHMTIPSSFIVNNSIISPSVLRVMEEHSLGGPQRGCSYGGGAPLEERGVGFSHWEQRYFLGEYMCPSAFPSPVISNFTLALLEDLGYGVNYSLGEPFYYGMGECFLESFCPEWCTPEDPPSCSPTLRGWGGCGVQKYSYSLPEEYQFFPDPTMGGPVFSEYCPVVSLDVVCGEEEVCIEGVGCSEYVCAAPGVIYFKSGDYYFAGGDGRICRNGSPEEWPLISHLSGEYVYGENFNLGDPVFLGEHPISYSFLNSSLLLLSLDGVPPGRYRLRIGRVIFTLGYLIEFSWLPTILFSVGFLLILCPLSCPILLFIRKRIPKDTQL